MTKSIYQMSRSLLAKIVFLVCAVALLSSITIGGLDYTRVVKTTMRSSITSFATETRLVSSQLDGAFRDMRDDILILSSTSPIGGLMRSIDAGGTDPLDGSTTSHWRSRMQAIFKSILRTKPHYFQIRIIGLADGGREIVRVDRKDSQIAAASPDQLQKKGEESYFKLGASLESGATALSEINYNREHGAIDQSLTPTIRIVMPLFSPRGERFGMIVINVNFEQIVQDELNRIQPPHDVIIANGAGDYVVYNVNKGASRMHLSIDDGFVQHQAVADAQTLPSGSTTDLDGTIYYFLRADFGAEDARKNLIFLMYADRDVLLADAYMARRQSLIATMIVVIFSVAFALVIATRLMRPLQRMTREVRRFEQGQQALKLPITSDDEVGELARAFESMTKGLQASETKIRSVMNSVSDGLIVIDATGRVDIVNPACERIFGYSADEIVGRNVKMLTPTDYQGQFDGYLKTRCELGSNMVIDIGREIECRRKDGSTFPADLSVSEMKLGDRRLYCGTIRDITERKHMEIVKNEFVSTVNHELRTPLTSIQGSLGILKVKAAGKLDEKGERLLELASNGAERLGHLVNDILDLEKIAAGKMDYRIEPVEIGVLVHKVVDSHMGIADKYNVRFETQCNLPETLINLDASRFNQALVNLLSNASKYSPAGEAVVIEVATAPDGRIRVSVTDRGPGIPDSFRDKIFERFTQANSSTTRMEGSSGLGLNITKTIIEAFDGTVTFDTAEGEGTTFHFFLPVYIEMQGAA